MRLRESKRRSALFYADAVYIQLIHPREKKETKPLLSRKTPELTAHIYNLMAGFCPIGNETKRLHEILIRPPLPPPAPQSAQKIYPTPEEKGGGSCMHR